MLRQIYSFLFNLKKLSLEYGGRRIVEVRDHFVVKFGLGVNLIEGENMLFIQKHTNVFLESTHSTQV